jgi:hypothetical protein
MVEEYGYFNKIYWDIFMMIQCFFFNGDLYNGIFLNGDLMGFSW